MKKNSDVTPLKSAARHPASMKKQQVRFITVKEGQQGQRIDNFLAREIKAVPRSYLYRILRKGEVRINKKRVKPASKLEVGDVIRIPPVYLGDEADLAVIPDSLLSRIQASIVLEDDDLIVLNKPTGLAVHGGTGVRFGLIEAFRQLRPGMPFVELVHRLDKDTSGLVMLAKNRVTLLALHELIKNGAIEKHYQTLVFGEWKEGTRQLTDKLEKKRGVRQKIRVTRDPQAKAKEAVSLVTPRQHYYFYDDVLGEMEFTLLDVEIKTGRMHQIRTQLAARNHPVMGDSQYGDFSANRRLKKQTGLKRLFLHAFSLSFVLPDKEKHYHLTIPLADDLNDVLKQLKPNKKIKQQTGQDRKQ